MSYRKLIALTVFGAAVFLQGCDEDDEEVPEVRCSNSNVIIKAGEDDVITHDQSNLFTAIETEAAKDTDDDVLDEYENCLACLVDEYKQYEEDQSADFDAEDVVESCWKTNAAMEACGATETELLDCSGTPCASTGFDFANFADLSKQAGDCLLCLEVNDYSESDAKATSALDTCGFAAAEHFDACDGTEVDETATDSGGTAADLRSKLDTAGSGAAACQACIDVFDAVTDCDDLKTSFTAFCGGTIKNAYVCETPS